MAKCGLCTKEMLSNVSCVKRVYVLTNGKKFEAIKSNEERCHDCACKKGHYHHIGCDMERCPNCRGQFISCDCDFLNEMEIHS